MSGLEELYHQIVRLRNLGHIDQAGDMAAKMCRKWKKEPVFWIELAGCHALKYDFAKARQAVQKALQLGRSQSGIFELAANTMLSCDVPEEAIRILRQGRKLHPGGGNMDVSLATLLERQHGVDEAAELVHTLLQKDPAHGEGLWLQAVLDKREKQPGQAVEHIERLLSENQPSQQTRHLLWKALYLKIRCLDEMKQYSDAVNAIREASDFTREWYAEDVQLCQQSWEHRREAMEGFNQNLNKDQLCAWQNEEPRTDQKICFLSGHPRSGTTLAGTILSSHPDTCQVDEKEIFYRFTFIPLLLEHPQAQSDMERLSIASPKSLTKYAKKYLKLAARVTGDSGGRNMIIEKHPLHIYSAPAALRIFPGSTHIVMLRDPRAIALSCLMTGTKLTPFSVNWLDPVATAKSYDSIMAAWEKTKNWEIPHVHPVKYEDLVTEQEKTTRQLASWTGMEWNDELLNYREKAKEQAATSPTYEQVTRPIYTDSLEKWRHYQELLEPAMPLLEQAATRMGY
jgi:tetratricopeptide (TPR) repeat protein